MTDPWGSLSPDVGYRPERRRHGEPSTSTFAFRSSLLVVSYVMPTPKVDEDKTVLEVCGENIMQSIVHAVIYLAVGLVLHAVIR